jgi:IS30 family transposase
MSGHGHLMLAERPAIARLHADEQSRGAIATPLGRSEIQ